MVSHGLMHIKALAKNKQVNDVAFIFMAGICRSGALGLVGWCWRMPYGIWLEVFIF